MDVFILCLAAVALLFTSYSIIPTIAIRVSGKEITKRIKGQKGIALTFDDGPHPEFTIMLLDLLKRYRVKAAFFVVGHKAEKYPEIIRRMHQEGHVIGIHHYQHVSNWSITPFQLKKQMNRTQKVIRRLTGKRTCFYRPPWGHFNLFTNQIAKDYEIVIWSHIFGDWKAERSEHTLLRDLRQVPDDGSIILLHDCGETIGADENAPKYMIENLEVFLKESVKEGRQFITLETLNMDRRGHYEH